MDDKIKSHVLNIHELMNNLSAFKLDVNHQYYLQSNMQKDIPNLFSNYQHVCKDAEATKNLMECLDVIIKKLEEIHSLYKTDYKKNLEIKKKFIQQKTFD